MTTSTLPRRRAAPGALAAAALLAACAGASAPVPIAASCDTARVVPLDDTVHHLVHATLAPAADGSAALERARGALPAERAGLVLLSIANVLEVPPHLGIPPGSDVLEPITFVRDPGRISPRLILPEPTPPLSSFYSLATAVDFTLGPDGSLDDIVVSRVSSDVALTRAVAVALVTADTLGIVPAPSAGADGAPLRLRLALALDSLPGLASRPIFRAALPRRFDRRPEPMPRRIERPGFWPRAEPGEEWRAELRVVLDATGRPLAESIETLAATDTVWAEATRAALARTRYTPAVLDGCPVKARVVQPWTFLAR